MIRTIQLLVSLVAFTVVSLQSAHAQLHYFIDLETPGGVLPVKTDYDRSIGLPTGIPGSFSILNGPERIKLDKRGLTYAEGGAFGTTLGLPGFRSSLSISGGLKAPVHTWTGKWTIQRRSGPTSIPFTMNFRKHRFPLPNTPPAITSNRYRVTFASSPDDPAVGLFTINDDGTATGTFLTTTGDYRYLAGNAAGDSLKLSTFDGAHAFLFHAEKQADGSLKGDFWSGNWYHDTWTAQPDPDFRLPDPFAQTKYQGDAGSLERLDFLDLDGTPTLVGTVAPHGSPRVVEVFGSWCPNCHDATRLLVELNNTYKERGLVVLGLAFEHSNDPAKATAAVRTYATDLGVNYPLLIAGLSDKDKASEALPVLDRVRSFPTTMFIDADGTVRAVHSGFSGPAAGDAHTELRAEWVAHIEAMLDKADRQRALPMAD